MRHPGPFVKGVPAETLDPPAKNVRGLEFVKIRRLVELKEIRTLIDLMKKNGLAVFKMEREGFKITLKTAGAESVTQVITSAPAAPLQAATVAASAAAAPAGSPAPEASNLREIKSPMVGTFYSASSPDTPPYISVGQEVTPETVVCIVEAMKVMN